HVDLNSGQAKHDIEIDAHDGPYAAVEVTEDLDNAFAQWASQNTPRVPVTQCHHGWRVEMDHPPEKPRKWAKKELEPFLLELEKRNIAKTTIYPSSPVWVKIPPSLRDLGFVSAQVTQNIVPSGEAFLEFGWWSESKDRNYPSKWLEDFVASARCAGERAKLAASGFSERHLAVVIPFTPASARDTFWALMAIGMGRREPPATIPRLPSEVTHCWIVCNYPGVVSLYLSAKDGWQVISPLTPTIES
ncbi:hypothetical protein, partial [Pseudofrankia asymbiotica]